MLDFYSHPYLPNSPACFQEIIELILYQYRHFCLLYVHIGSGYNGNFYRVRLGYTCEFLSYFYLLFVTFLAHVFPTYFLYREYDAKGYAKSKVTYNNFWETIIFISYSLLPKSAWFQRSFFIAKGYVTFKNLHRIGYCSKHASFQRTFLSRIRNGK